MTVPKTVRWSSALRCAPKTVKAGWLSFSMQQAPKPCLCGTMLSWPTGRPADHMLMKGRYRSHASYPAFGKGTSYELRRWMRLLILVTYCSSHQTSGSLAYSDWSLPATMTTQPCFWDSLPVSSSTLKLQQTSVSRYSAGITSSRTSYTEILGEWLSEKSDALVT